MKCYHRGATLNDLRVSFFFFFQKILNCSRQRELYLQHTYLDLTLTNELYKGIIYSGVLLNSY